VTGGALVFADGLKLSTNLAGYPEDVRGALYRALGRHLGCCEHEMEKAVHGEPPDPRYPELEKLIRAAQRDWTRWGSDLVDEVSKLVGGKKLPLSASLELRLQELLQDHQIRLAAIFSGRWPGKLALPPNVLLFRKELGTSPTEAAFHLGRVRQVFEVHFPPTKERPLSEAVKEALAKPMTKQEKAALRYVQDRSFQYMRRPAWGAAEALGAELVQQEYADLRDGLAGAVERREGPVAIKHRLQEALQGHPTLQNDLDRVVRTETHFAHAFGAYVALKEGAAKSGEEDPEVYKLVSPRACPDCRRLWGDPNSPKRYRLSEIETWEAQGGNFKKPHKEWKAVIGPTHPNCTEGPLQYFDEELDASIKRAAKAFLDKQEE